MSILLHRLFPVALLALVVAAPAKAADQSFVTIGTGGVTGVYYPTGGAICRLVNKNRKTHGIRCSVESTDGSIANIGLLAGGEVEFALAQSDVQATAASRPEGAKLRAAFSLQVEPLHIMVRTDADIAGIADLKGKRVNIGNPGSGQRASAELLLKAAGLTVGDLSLAAELPSAEQAAALCDNKIDAALFTAGTPNGSVKEASRSCDITLVSLDEAFGSDFLAANKGYIATSIPGGTYRGADADVQTVGPVAVLLTTTEVPADTVFQVVKAVFDDFDRFKALHPAFAGLDKKAMLVRGIGIPLHAGAIAYFKQAGLLAQ
ncbi:MAG: TAXI family TRAP transporter solute-binding subunit [Rhodospirillales bacterium]